MQGPLCPGSEILGSKVNYRKGPTHAISCPFVLFEDFRPRHCNPIFNSSFCPSSLQDLSTGNQRRYANYASLATLPRPTRSPKRDFDPVSLSSICCILPKVLGGFIYPPSTNRSVRTAIVSSNATRLLPLAPRLLFPSVMIVHELKVAHLTSPYAARPFRGADPSRDQELSIASIVPCDSLSCEIVTPTSFDFAKRSYSLFFCSFRWPDSRGERVPLLMFGCRPENKVRLYPDHATLEQSKF